MDLAVRSGFVCEHTLHGFERIDTGFLLKGEIACLGEIVITVYKELEIVGVVADDFKVQTRRYAYNASVRGFSNFLRYDDAHEYPGHQDRYHRHDFDWRTGHEASRQPALDRAAILAGAVRLHRPRSRLA
jgi:hypothetical protein